MAENKDVSRMIDWWEGTEASTDNRNAYWKALSSARKEFNQANGLDSSETSIGTSLKFKIWLSDIYGVEMQYEGSNISGRFGIVDAEKYTMFLLKHSAS